MEIKYKLYPYPVLSSYSNDYGTGSFDVAIDIVRDGYDLRIDFLATLTCKSLGAIIEAKAQGLPIDTNIVGELAKYLNLLGGIYILDCLPEQRIYDKILAKANEICKVQEKETA